MEATKPWVVRELPLPGSPDLWLLRISDVPRDVLDDSVLDVTERQRAASLMQAEDRDRFSAAHVALRRMLGSYLDQPPGDLRFDKDICPCCGGPHGRPILRDAPRDLFFSLSHRGDLALVGAAVAPIGVDVDLVPSKHEAAELASMLHPDERRELAAVPPELLPRAVARLWTRKEAYLKGIGTGLGRDPSLDYVGSGSPQGPLPPEGWTLLDLPVDRGYAAAVAVNGTVTGRPTVNRLSALDVARATCGVLLDAATPART